MSADKDLILSKIAGYSVLFKPNAGAQMTLFGWGYYRVKFHKAWRHFHLPDFSPHYQA